MNGSKSKDGEKAKANVGVITELLVTVTVENTCAFYLYILIPLIKIVCVDLLVYS